MPPVRGFVPIFQNHSMIFRKIEDPRFRKRNRERPQVYHLPKLPSHLKKRFWIRQLADYQCLSASGGNDASIPPICHQLLAIPPTYHPRLTSTLCGECSSCPTGRIFLTRSCAQLFSCFCAYNNSPFCRPCTANE